MANSDKASESAVPSKGVLKKYPECTTFGKVKILASYCHWKALTFPLDRPDFQPLIHGRFSFKMEEK